MILILEAVLFFFGWRVSRVLTVAVVIFLVILLCVVVMFGVVCIFTFLAVFGGRIFRQTFLNKGVGLGLGVRFRIRVFLGLCRIDPPPRVTV